MRFRLPSILAAVALTAAAALLPSGHAPAATFAEAAEPAMQSIPGTVVVPGGPAVVSTAPPATQNTVTTTGPVSSDTTISVGTLAGQLLMYVASAFVVAVGGVLTVLIKRWATSMGIQVTQQMSDQLNATLVNGLNDAAVKTAASLAGRGAVEVHNAIVNGAVAYAQDHRADTIKALGLDPQSGAAVAALNARIATLVQDPSVPTPAVLATSATVPKAA
jgi:hypothetical protein